MTKVIMLANDRAAPEGHTVVVYEKGEQYEVPEWIADHFIKRETAEAVESKSKKPGK